MNKRIVNETDTVLTQSGVIELADIFATEMVTQLNKDSEYELFYTHPWSGDEHWHPDFQDEFNYWYDWAYEKIESLSKK